MYANPPKRRECRFTHPYALSHQERASLQTRIMARLGTGPATRTDIARLFDGNEPAWKLREVLADAEEKGLVCCVRIKTAGRPKDIFYPLILCEESAREGGSGEHAVSLS